MDGRKKDEGRKGEEKGRRLEEEQHDEDFGGEGKVMAEPRPYGIG